MNMTRRMLLGVLSLAVAGGSATAQTSDPGSGVFLGGPKEKKEKVPTSRTLKGTVTDTSGKPLEGALVTLTNDTTKERHSFFTKKDGRYLFAELSFTQDYEVVARYKDELSTVRRMSQYDRRPNVVHILSVNPQTPDKKAEERAASPKTDTAPQ